MAKTPGTPKGKTNAPAQFDMNSRERKGGKGGAGGPGGPGRGREEKRPPSRIVTAPPSLVDRGEGWVIQKIGKIDQASHVAVGAEYHLIFEGHDPLVFDHLGAARGRAKEAPPEHAPAEDAQAEHAEPAELAAEPAEEAAADPSDDAPEPIASPS